MKREMFLCLTFAKDFSSIINLLIYYKKQFICFFISYNLFYLYKYKFKPFQTFLFTNPYLILCIFKPYTPQELHE